MPDPVMVTVATTLVAWATTAVADQARAATTAVVAFIRDRFTDHPQQQVVDTALDPSSDQPAIEQLADLLDREASHDPEFAQNLQRLWERAVAEVRETGTSGHVNQVTGNVSGSVVQARDVSGGISFGGPSHPPGPHPG